MSIIVSVKLNDGVVMASDSATTFLKPDGSAGQIYENANKIVNLIKGLPIGVMACGAGGIGNASIATLLKDLRALLSPEKAELAAWRVDRDHYTMEEIAGFVQRFFADRAHEVGFSGFLLMRICGYSAGAPLPEIWEVQHAGAGPPTAICIQDQQSFGLKWEGEFDALNRLILCASPKLTTAVMKQYEVPQAQADAIIAGLIPYTVESMIINAAPIQDAIDLARFMVETTIGFMRFAVDRPKTVGGPVEIAAITKYEGFKWVQRKHFYPHEINRA